ncbi:MAG: mechanosensitive ion channel family protein, partial [Planctomycetota bacterium]
TVGLGFGLQAMFANVISGLIILFERPLRVGDTVSIGENIDTVKRIRIRATTIAGWDRREIVVPNRELLSAKVVNWSLSDKVLRITLRVGIAYGSDTRLAEQVLHEAAGNDARVLDDPKPMVLFTAFGDSALEFELRVYVKGVENYLSAMHDLNVAIDRALRDAGITIAYPQRDTHLDSVAPLEVRLLPPDQTQ